MQYLKLVSFVLTVLGLVGCSAGQFQAGRQELLKGNPEVAVGYFSAVAEQRPNYVYVIQNYRESIWTYLGRAQYETKRYPEARRSLDKALAMNKGDGMAMLYLGLTGMRSGDNSQGAKQIEAGLRNIKDWIEYMNRTHPLQDYWDRTQRIRKQTDAALGQLATREFNQNQLISNAESIGKSFEEELDKVREDERREFERDGEDNRSS